MENEVVVWSHGESSSCTPNTEVETLALLGGRNHMVLAKNCLDRVKPSKSPGYDGAGSTKTNYVNPDREDRANVPTVGVPSLRGIALDLYKDHYSEPIAVHYNSLKSSPIPSEEKESNLKHVN